MFGITKFHKYLYGREFLLQTDRGLLKEDRTISAMASARIQRWALTLSNYQYTWAYKPVPSIGHADANWTAKDPVLSQVERGSSW